MGGLFGLCCLKYCWKEKFLKLHSLRAPRMTLIHTLKFQDIVNSASNRKLCSCLIVYKMFSYSFILFHPMTTLQSKQDWYFYFQLSDDKA